LTRPGSAHTEKSFIYFRTPLAEKHPKTR
jgi:hypothetical protein